MLLRLASLLIIATLTGLDTHAQERRRDQPISEDLYELVRNKADVIKREITESKDEWSGTYLAGDHHPTVLMFSTKSGFLVTSSLHTFSPSWVNYGNVKLTSGQLIIYPELTKENKSAHVMGTEFVPILWDRQHFLIPSNELRSFAYAVHSKAESQIVEYFAKSEDSDKPRRGLPKLPAEYTKYLKMQPIVTRITGVGPEKQHWPSLTIGAGRRDGMIEGMTLYHISRSGVHLSVRVTKVSERTSQAEVSMIGSSGSDEEIRLQVGWRLTSQLPKSFIEPD